MDETKNCPLCTIDFPDHLIQVMFTSEGNMEVCPICALDIQNTLHGIERTEFSGEMANQMLFEARAYLEGTK